MATRLLWGGLYMATALLLGNWALYLDIYSEASLRPISMSTYWLGITSLLFAAAGVAYVIKPRQGLKLGVVACAVALPLLALAVVRAHWSMPRDQYELSSEGALLMIAVATVLTFASLGRRVRKTSRGEDSRPGAAVSHT
jgi:hypothetical protein